MQICIGSTRWLSEWDIHARQWGGKGVLKGKVLCEPFARCGTFYHIFDLFVPFLQRLQSWIPPHFDVDMYIYSLDLQLDNFLFIH
jgi:hypothetical protein